MKAKKTTVQTTGSQRDSDFAYIGNQVYFDSACQSLRPQPVIDAMNQYYTEFNSCGERVRYQWGQTVDKKVTDTRHQILDLLKLSPKNYFVSFTLNTTYGLNLILNQLDASDYKKVVTSDIEHNSVFLSTLAFANKNQLEREVVVRNHDGSIELDEVDFSQAVVVLNAVSNIDGRQLLNINEIAKKIRRHGGLFIVDAAQAIAHNHQMLQGVDADAICFSSHKMYGPSLGVIVAKKSLVQKIRPSFIGGGMVGDVTRDNYVMLSDEDEHIHTIFEAGLQPYAEIVGLGAAVKWLKKHDQEQHRIDDFIKQVVDELGESDSFHILSQTGSATIALYHDHYDSHLLAEALSDSGIMLRSGYFCAHYYLKDQSKLPPLIRVSMGLHNRQSDVDKLIKTLQGIKRS